MEGPQGKLCFQLRVQEGGGGLVHDKEVRGGIRNRRNSGWQNLAHQKCTNFCCGVSGTEAVFPGVIFSALGMHSLRKITAIIQNP